ncbi:hypothetical protein TELCIR_23998, partial [Teladorsagia circumcincta]
MTRLCFFIVPHPGANLFIAVGSNTIQERFIERYVRSGEERGGVIRYNENSVFSSQMHLSRIFRLPRKPFSELDYARHMPKEYVQRLKRVVPKKVYSG